MKILNKLLHWLISPFTVGFIVTMAMLSIAHLYYSRYQNSEYDGESKFFDLIREAHQKSVDFRLLMRGEVLGHPDVAILAIDETSIEQEGRWPWPREKIGRVVDKAIDLGVKTVAFDIVFAEEDGNSSVPTLKRIRKDLSKGEILTPELNALFLDEMTKADSDRKFAEVIARRGDHLVMGTYFDALNKISLEGTSPFFDICIDEVHRRSPAYVYWKNDQATPLVRDDYAEQNAFPPVIRSHLNQYLGIVENGALTRWLVDRPDVVQRFKDGYTRLGISEEVPIEALLQPLFAKDIAALAATLEGLQGEAPSPELLQGVLDLVEEVLPKKDATVASDRMRTAATEYCNRFLSQDSDHLEKTDELLSPEAFENRYGKEIDFALLGWEPVWETANKSGEELPTAHFKDFFASIQENPRRNHISVVDRWWTNIPILADNTKHSAFFNAHLDSDGTIRRNMFLARRGNHYAGSLALMSFLVSKNARAVATVAPSASDPHYRGIPGEGVTIPDSSDEASARAPASLVKVPGFQIIRESGDPVLSVPLDPSGRMMINYAGPQHTFPHISAADILSDSDEMFIKTRLKDPVSGKIQDIQRVKKREFLKDKILFFGATAVGVYDLRVTPFEENFPGVETHANMLSNLLVEEARATGNAASVAGLPGFLRTFPEKEGPLMIAAMLAGGLLLSGLLTYFGSIAGLAITATSLGGVYALDRFVLFNSGIVTTILLPISEISALFVSLTFYKYFTEERKKRELKGTFEKYVSPAIVAEVLSDPSNIELGGKKMDLTVMFSDVRGFTTISEKLDPRALSDLLNSYLTPMTNLVFTHKGTLDKYMGDAIMAFWGAPIHFPDHAKHACRCALEMLDKLKELQAEYRAKGLPEIDIGIGLNSGEMSVGNMGSDTVRSYTVMGDSVNLGSRLEGINKQYGTRIIVSEFTYEAIKDSFICREVDWVRVKGKAQPVRIFELVAEKSTSSETQKLLEAFSKGFSAYHAKDWDTAIALFTEALSIKADDEPSQLYLERCTEYKQNPPPEDWDGVCTMTTK